MNRIKKSKIFRRLLAPLLSLFLLFTSYYSFSQKVENLTDAQVKEFIKRAESSGMSESDIEKYALSRGYSQADILKLKDRIAAIKSPASEIKAASKSETKDESRTISGNDTEKQGDQGNSQKKDNFNERLDESIQNIKDDYVFGSNLFNGKNLTFEPNLRLATPKNYVLGVDDELIIDIYGNSQMSYKVKISTEGSVKIENLAPIVINGLTIDQASDRIINRLKTIYYGLNSQGGGVYAQITLGSIRSIKVTVIGEASKPGTYSVPSLATVYNVLYQAGGPSRNGSYRKISVIRDNKVIRNMDLYDFLLRADQKDNILVRDQDIIRIGDYEKRVQLRGEVKRPAIFEVEKDETLKTVFGFAGNFTDKAYKKSIKLTRVTDKEYKIFTIKSEDIGSFSLEPGDVYQIDLVSTSFENRVKITGAVYRPGDFAIDDKNIKTVKDLINAAGGLKIDAFKNRAIIVRDGQFKEPETVSFDLEKLMKNEIDDIALQKEDSVNINSVSSLHERFTVSIFGQVNKPKQYLYKNNMTVADLIIEAGGFTEGASASKIELSRRVKKDSLGATLFQNVKIFEFDVNENLTINSNENKYILEPFDIISVKASPTYEVQQDIFIQGEVLYPGKYIVKDREERLADIIKRCGGLRPSAFLKGATILRRRNIVSLNFQKAIEDENSLDNILLIRGDSINIPRKSETVNIIGGVFNSNIVTFNPNAKLSDYISQSGGFVESALTRKVYVTYPNGASARTKSFLFFRSYPKIEPGSTIIVPELNKGDVQKLTPVEKSSIITAFVSMTGILFTIIKSLTQ